MNERARQVPVQVETKLLAAEKARLLAIHKSTQYLTFENIPFKDGNKNPLIVKLRTLQGHKPNSIPGTVLIELFNKIQDKLDQEHPVVKRVFIGEMLKRLKVKGNAPGMVPFMRLILKETKSMQPLMVKHIKSLVMMVKTMPDSPFKRRMVKELFGYGGLKKSKGRPGDPLFGEGSDSREGETLAPYGILEDVEPFDVNAEVMSQAELAKLDPFQLILYKRLVMGHKKFAQQMVKEFSPLFKYHHLRYVKKAVYKAISDFADWVKDTVSKMSISNVSKLPAIYQAQLQKFKLPSLPHTVPVPAPFWAHISQDARNKIGKAEKKLTNIRSKVEKRVKKELKGGIDTIKTLSIFGPLLKRELARKKMFRSGPNRTFLNRFWTLAYRKFQNSSGDEKLQYEFFAMALDCIKDDNELIQIKKRIIPFLIAVLKLSPDAQKLSKRYFGKNFNALTGDEINEVVDLLLPSRTLTLRQKNTREYKDILAYMKMVLDMKLGIDKIKQKNYPVYVAITTVSHNLINIYTSLINERDSRKAKKKIGEFVRAFATLKKLIGREGMQQIKQKSPGFVNVLNNPSHILNRLKAHPLTLPSIKSALTEFERLHRIKRPEVVNTAMKKVEKIEGELLKLEKYYVAKRDRAFKKGVIDYGILRTLKIVRRDLQKVRTIINFLFEATDKESYKTLLAMVIKKNLYSTRYLKVSPATQKHMSFTAVEEAKHLKPDYDNLFYVSKVVKDYVNMVIRTVYRKNGLSFATSRALGVVQDIILTYGYNKQKELGNQGAYEFLKNPANRKAFVAEIVKRVNGFLRTAKVTDSKNQVVQIRPIVGKKSQPDQLNKHIERYITTRILPKAKKSYVLRSRKRRSKQPS